MFMEDFLINKCRRTQTEREKESERERGAPKQGSDQVEVMEGTAGDTMYREGE